MMLALVLIVATETAPAPVPAAPRSLSDYAREHRGLLHSGAEPARTGGFSAAESTIPREPFIAYPVVEDVREEPQPEREPQEQQVGVIPAEYGPAIWGGIGGRPVRGGHPGRPGRHPAPHSITHRPTPQPLARPFPSFASGSLAAGQGRVMRP